MDIDIPDFLWPDGGGELPSGGGSTPDPHHKPRGGGWMDLHWPYHDHGKAGDPKAKPKPSFVDRVRGWPIRPRMYTARGFGELASIAAAPVAMVVVDKGFHQPYEDMKNRFAEKVILPNLAKWDANLGKLKSFDPPFEREERHALSEPEQARKIADLWVDQFGVKLGGSLLGQWAAQDYFINKFNAGVSKKHNAMSVFVDRGVQLGSAFALNTVFSDQAIAMQSGLIKVFEKAGMDEEKAEEWANYAVNFSVPNAVAYLVSAEMLTQLSKRA